ncbi:MAG: arylsulfotransferase family protein [Solirubrobacterales bacterium]|nr:arylsulfotransferase family protein [Solirubrobacterales bacterium]MBV9536362.1 arylsulfotransferase family protein [Solirubrobacterales bacterium]
MVAHPPAGEALASASQGLDVLPFPGTPDAAPATNIDFPAIPARQIASITAMGSRSGLHSGRLSAQPAGHGTAFTPSRPFTPGEAVSVTATLRTPAAGTASGAPHATRLHYTFAIARRATVPVQSSSSAGILGATGPHRHSTHRFVTEPGFRVPVVTMGTNRDHRAGDVFLDVSRSVQSAAMILSGRNHLVWYRPLPKRPLSSAYNVERQTYRGQHVLTYWQGHGVCPPCGGEGDDLILDHSYRTIHRVTAGDGYRKQGTDLHEFLVTRDGSEEVAYVPLWSPVKANLTSVGGPSNGTAFDWIIQEIDIATNKVIWEWQSLGHVPLTDSYSPYTPGQPYEYFHMNSIQQLSDGHLIISARNTWTVYSIDKATGKIAWQLGGKHSTFRLGRGTRFYWQHDATLHRNGLLTLFDDGAAPKEEAQSRALEIHIGLGRHQARLVRQFTHSPPTQTAGEGSAQLLSNRDLFVGWGYSPYFSEYSPNGAQIFNGSFQPPIQSYRAFRDRWVGMPLQPPAIAVRASSTAGRDKVYASWNGATQVVRWRLLAGASPTALKAVKRVRRSGFETEIEAHKAKYFEVRALDSKGHALPHGTSAVVRGA